MGHLSVESQESRFLFQEDGVTTTYVAVPSIATISTPVTGAC